jgi:cyclophilin family peptidyl-prolyl cis-trans isomerase
MPFARIPHAPGSPLAAPRAGRRPPCALAALALSLALVAGTCSEPAAAQAAQPAPGSAQTRVRVDTNLGSFLIELEDQRAPLTVANFLGYVRSGFYSGTVFHRVINNFIAQAGGYDEKYQPKTPQPPVVNESGNGLSNRRGTVGLARTDAPHSGNAQFFLNLADNEDLDPTPLRWGYAVFGRVVDGLEVVDRIGHVATGADGPFEKDAPLEKIVIRKMEIVAGPGAVAPEPAPAPAAPPST